MQWKYTRSAWITEFLPRSWIRCERKNRSLAPVSLSTHTGCRWLIWVDFTTWPKVEMVGKPHSSSNLPSKYRKCWEIVKFCDTYYAATTRIPTMWFTSNPHSSSRIVTYLVSIAVPSTRCAHHACTNLRNSSFHSNIHALRVFSRMYLMDTSRCRMVWAFNCTGTGTEIFC